MGYSWTPKEEKTNKQKTEKNKQEKAGELISEKDKVNRSSIMGYE